MIYAMNEQQLFVPGSTTKLLTEGTALELLGGDYRFHTRVYRTGKLKSNGTLKGDLVLVGSGDPDLSNRIQADGTLAFENEDHSYGGPDSKGLSGDPLLVVHELARQVEAKGIKRVEGRVLVNTSLFPEGNRELGTGVVLSPIVVDDNVVDVIVSAGPAEGSAATLQISPKTAYVQIINNVRTGKAASNPDLNYENEKRDPGGNWAVTLNGRIPLGASAMNSYPVPEPSRYAAVLLTESLEQAGIRVKIPKNASADAGGSSTNYAPEDMVAEHVSPPFKEDVKITLKISQNLHASMMPALLGALVSKKEGKGAEQAGFDLEHEFLRKANLDLSGAAQSDGAGGNAFFTPDFMVSYLKYMHEQKDFDDFYRGLPILGRDGTLFKIQVNSPAAGHVHAKTGTYDVYNALGKNLILTGKGLAGYMETAEGERLIFALYVNMVPLSMDPEAAQTIAGQALGEISTAAYQTVSRTPAASESGIVH
jgi:D-alanyl-D-alanine carboxypeptidase/D-alanyl-D-alanine-endopeptidase (penicillin-binding protein 4)